MATKVTLCVSVLTAGISKLVVVAVLCDMLEVVVPGLFVAVLPDEVVIVVLVTVVGMGMELGKLLMELG